MIIPIHIALPTTPGAPERPKLPPTLVKLGDADSDELVLVELQGSLEVEGPKAGQHVGTFRLREGKPTLMIGHHLLEGKITNLAKPLAILHKSEGTLAPTTMGTLDDKANTSTAITPTPSWDMVAIVKRKIVFAKRPTPIVGQKAAEAKCE